MTRRQGRESLLPRIATEFLIIVLGVLVALQFESWRDGYVDRVRADEQLRALQADFEINTQQIRDALASQRRAVGSAHALLLQFDPGNRYVPADSVATLFFYALSWYAVETVSGAYDALLGSGDLGIIRNDDLRRQLAEFYGLLDAGFEDHENEMSVLSLLLEESSGQIREFIAPDQFPFIASGVSEVATRELLASEAFSGLLTWKLLLAQFRAAWLSDLATKADSILALIETELAR